MLKKGGERKGEEENERERKRREEIIDREER